MVKADEALRTALRQQEQNAGACFQSCRTYSCLLHIADKFREENWNLEVTLQDLHPQLSESQGTARRGEIETKRLAKVLASARGSSDGFKNELENAQRAYEDLRFKHENDVASHRKQTTLFARDKSDLQQSIDNHKAELARVSRRLPRQGSPFTPGGMEGTPGMDDDEKDPFGSGTTGMGMSTNCRRLDTSA